MKYLLTILKFLICQVLTQENDNKSNKSTTSVNSKTRTNTRPNESKNLKLYNNYLK